MVLSRSCQNRWVVLVTAYVIISLCMSQMYVMGTMFPYIMDWFNTNRAQTAVVQSTVLATFPLGGVFYGSFISRMGPKFVCIIGTLLGTAGLIISFFATSLAYLTASLGVLFSLGFAMQFMSCNIIVGRSFEGRLGFIALSILSTAVGVGSMVYNFFMAFLLEQYGVRGTLLILAAIALHGLPLGHLWPSQLSKATIMKENTSINAPTSTTNKKPIPNEQENATIEDANASKALPQGFDYNSIRLLLSFTNADVIKSTLIKGGTAKLTVNNPTLSGDTKSQNSKMTSFMKNRMNTLQRMTHIIKNVNFILFIIGSVISVPISQIILVIVVDWSLDKGFTQADGAFALLVINGFGLVGRIAPGFIMLIPKMTALSFPIIGSLLGFSSYLAMAFVSSFSSLLITCALSGMTIGMLITCFTVTLITLVEREYMPEAMGILLTSFGVASTSAGPLTGYIRDMTGSYTTSFLVAAVGMSLATCVTGVNQYLAVKQRRRQSRSRRSSIFYVTKM